jgi:hypothetical protein
MRSAEEIMIQSKVLQAQLRVMKAKGMEYAEEFQQGIGKLRAICWIMGSDEADKSLALDNKQLARMELIHGCF